MATIAHSTSFSRVRRQRSLATVLDGKLFIPEHAAYDQARLAWNVAIEQRPAAVVLPESADDVVAAVLFAREHGLRVAAQGTGHNPGPLGSLEDTVLIKTERMRRVEIDPTGRVARVEAGVLWQEVVEAAAAYGLGSLQGSSPDVGVIGYTIGGGASFMGRKYGLAANMIKAVELVTAEGRIVRADQENEPDLFWALRGGGGSFGVVTAIELELFRDQRDLRRHSLVPGRARRRGAPGVARAHARPPSRRADHGRTDPALPADPRGPRAGARPVVCHRRGLPRRRSRHGRPATRAPAGARTRQRHDRDDLDARPQRRAHGPRPSRPERRRRADARRTAATGDRRVGLGRRCRDEVPAALGPAPPPRGRVRTSPSRRTARWRRSTRNTRCTPTAWPQLPSSPPPSTPRSRRSSARSRDTRPGTCTSTSPRPTAQPTRSGPSTPTGGYSESRPPSIPTTSSAPTIRSRPPTSRRTKRDSAPANPLAPGRTSRVERNPTCTLLHTPGPPPPKPMTLGAKGRLARRRITH